MIELTKKLIEFRSETKEEIDRCLDFIKELIQEKVERVDITIEEFNESSSLFAKPKNPDKPFVLLNGHIDVVPASDKEYIPRVKGDFLFGRGAGDMKSGIAIAIELFIKHYDSNIGLLINSDEETGGHNGAGIMAKNIHPELVIVTEPTNNEILLKEKGAMWIDIEVQGPGGHASRPWLAKSAIDILMEIIQDIKSEIKNPKRDEWTDTISIGKFVGGSNSANQIAQKAETRLDVRLTDKTQFEDIENLIKTIIEKRKSQGLRISMNTFHRVAHLNTDENNKAVRKIMKIAGLDKIKKGHAASDGRYFSEQGIPTILFGPNSIDHHSDNEKVEISSITKSFRILDEFLTDWT